LRVFVKVVKVVGLLYTISIFEFVRQLNSMELVLFGIVWSGDMKVICKWIEWKGKWWNRKII